MFEVHIEWRDDNGEAFYWEQTWHASLGQEAPPIPNVGEEIGWHRTVRYEPNNTHTDVIFWCGTVRERKFSYSPSHYPPQPEQPDVAVYLLVDDVHPWDVGADPLGFIKDGNMEYCP